MAAARAAAACQLGLGGERYLFRNAGRLAPGEILGPLLRQVKLAVDQRMPFAAGISYEHANLAVLDAPGSAAVLACHAGRPLTLIKVGRGIRPSKSDRS